MALPGPATPIRFGAFELNAATGELRKAGITVKLHPQPCRVLLLLTQHAGQIVTREQIREQLWGQHTFVDFEHGINFCIAQVRGTLGDNPEKPRYVETLARRGYRFIAPVSMGAAQTAAPVDVSLSEQSADQSPVTAAAPIEDRESAKQIRVGAFAANRKYLLTALCLVVVAAVKLGWGWYSRQNVAAIRSLAVLPLENLSNDPGQEYFADGMTDALTTDLSQVSALRVISRTSAMRYKKTDRSLPQIARELGVDAVVEGTVQRSGNRVRITAQLIQADTDKHIWARSYERDMQDILSLQGDIARTIAQEISVEVKPQEKLRMTRGQPVNLKAIEAYLQGQYHYQNAKELGFHFDKEKMHEAELNQAVAFFQRAVTEDPNYAPAFVGMGEIWGVPATFPYPPTSMEQPAREALRKALAIDPDLAEAYVDLGRMDYRYWNWSALEQEAKHAVALKPNLAAAHYLYSAYLGAVGRIEEAMEEAERTQALDPGTDRVAWMFYCQRRFDRFIELKRSDIARHAFGPLDHFQLGYGYERAHMFKEAVDEWEAAMSGFSDDNLARALRHGYTKSGFTGAMRAWSAGLESIAKQGGTVHPDLLAYLYSILGEKDRAFAWLEKSMEMHTAQPPALKIDPTLDELRSDPRFEELLRRVGLSP
jgi:TolB-like protein/DNA-binding winged helix-turn-helix (wHTH) protein